MIFFYYAVYDKPLLVYIKHVVFQQVLQSVPSKAQVHSRVLHFQLPQKTHLLRHHRLHLLFSRIQIGIFQSCLLLLAQRREPTLRQIESWTIASTFFHKQGTYYPNMLMVLGIFQRLYAKYREEEPYLRMEQE